MDDIKQAAQILINKCHGDAKSAGWWADAKTGLSASRRVERDEALSALLSLKHVFTNGITTSNKTVVIIEPDVLVIEKSIETIQNFILTRNRAELLMLMVSELAEAMEADRKGLMDDKLPHRNGVEVELADAVIRIFDTAGGEGLDVAGALVEKLIFNSQREDHKSENRIKQNGKRY